MADDVKKLLQQIVDFLPNLATKADVASALANAEARLNAKIEVEARVINARLDEQGRILAAMIPTTLAAVPPARQAPPPPAE